MHSPSQNLNPGSYQQLRYLGTRALSAWARESVDSLLAGPQLHLDKLGKQVHKVQEHVGVTSKHQDVGTLQALGISKLCLILAPAPTYFFGPGLVLCTVISGPTVITSMVTLTIRPSITTSGLPSSSK